MKKIPLTQGQFALVDDEDYEELSKLKWYAAWSNSIGAFYACREVRCEHTKNGYTHQYMHRRILGLKRGDRLEADHLNHNTLDNRRMNLTVANSRTNKHNLQKQSSYGPGVTSSGNGFRCRIYHGGKKVGLGTYSTPEEAREVYTRICNLVILHPTMGLRPMITNKGDAK
jgi:hypothetical protein